MNLHDQGINAIVNRLYSSVIPYTSIITEREYGPLGNGKVKGEIDVGTNYRDNTLLFEFKSRRTQKTQAKAYKQLERLSRHYHNIQKLKLFFCYWDKNKDLIIKRYYPKKMEVYSKCGQMF